METSFRKKSRTERLWDKTKTYKYTFILSSFSGFILFVSNIIHLETSKYFVHILNEINRLGIDGIIFMSFFIVTGIVIDILISNSKHKNYIMKENISYAVFKATMETLNDIMGNYIQTVQLYRSDMAGKSDSQIEKELDEVTELTLDKLRNLELTEEVELNLLFRNIHILKNKLTKQ